MSTSTAPASQAATKPRDWTRGYALAAGIAYLVTFAASIPALPMLAPLLDDPAGYALTGGADTQVAVGALLDTINAIACIATAVAVFPVVKRQNESLALGFVASRLMEAAIIMVGVISLMSVITLHQDVAGAAGTDAAIGTTGQALVAVRDWTFLFGPDVCAGMNALLFGTLLFRSRLVPRWIPTLGLIGGPLLLAASALTVLGVVEAGSIWFIGVLPLATWEYSVGVYMAVKGFRPSPLTAVAP